MRTRDRLIAAAQARIADALGAQQAAHLVAHRFKPVLDQFLAVELQLQMNAALQVEAKRKLALRQETGNDCRTVGENRFGMANSAPTITASQMSAVFHGEK
jgi:hypothetical protein